MKRLARLLSSQSLELFPHTLPFPRRELGEGQNSSGQVVIFSEQVGDRSVECASELGSLGHIRLVDLLPMTDQERRRVLKEAGNPKVIGKREKDTVRRDEKKRKSRE